MIDMTMYGRIQELKSKGYNKNRAAKELSIDKRTVARYWEMNDEGFAQYLLDSRERAKVLDPCRDFIINKLETYRTISSAIIEDHLRERFPDLTASARSIRLYVANLRLELNIPTPTKIRQYCEVEELKMGFQAQVDMGQKVMTDVYGKKVKVYIFAMVLSCSRKKFVCFQGGPFNATDFIKAHDLAFKYFSGRTTEIVYDQDRVMTVAENAGDLLLTEAFEDYYRYAGFSIRLCRGYDPESKGKIEAVVRYVKGNFLECRVIHGFSQLNSEGLAWLDRTANAKVHESTKMVPDRVFAEEISHLKKVPALSEATPPKVHAVKKTNVIHYKQNRYEVPKGTYAPGRTALIESDENAGRVRFFDVVTGELLAEHNLLTGVVGKKQPLPKNAERFRPTKYVELKIKVLSNFGGNEQAKTFIDRIIEKYPRYIRDQLNIIDKVQQMYSLDELLRAIAYCTERDLFSATDFRDTLEYFRQEQPAAPCSAKISLPVKYSSITAQTRDVSAYNQVAGEAVV